MEGVKVEVISRETIKPSSPTPPHLSTHMLSFLDQITTSIYVSIFLFYSKNTQTENHSIDQKNTNRCGWLKNSLSKVLTYYYPFAGRFIDSTAITCNDEGVDFYEAEVKCPLSQVLEQRDSDSLNVLFPKEFFMKESLEGSLLGVQINFFECGGMAVSLCISHKIVDGCSLTDFLSDWASVARQPSAELQVLPTFINMPPKGPLNFAATNYTNESAVVKTCVTKRFVIDPSKIALLKANAVESGLARISRVEVVTALLYERAVAAASIANKDSFKNSVLAMMVNMRPRMVPPLPPKYAGNFTWFVTTFNNSDMVNMIEFMGKLRNCVAEFCNKEKNNLKTNNWLSALPESLYNHMSVLAQLMEEKDTEKIMVDVAYKFSSNCSFPYYDVDFGIGKPQWVGLANGNANRLFILMPTKDGVGIEAMVILAEEEMKVFEQDEELLSFATLNIST